MAKVIPDSIDNNNARLDGERMVFEWFSNDDIPGTVYYSLLQKNHRHKMIGEIDFLYVTERGFICIEVKGGQKIYCSDKQWHSINKKGEDIKIKNPFRQAKDCHYALKEYFAQTYGRYSSQANYLIGYAVIFPECKFTGGGNDLVTEVMFDGSRELEDFPSFLNRTFDYWEQQEKEKHGKTFKKLNHEQLEQANNLLRGDFKVVPSMKLELQHVSQRMIELTDEQYDALDIADDNSRVMIRGSAGTGKTLLGIEMARRYSAREMKTLYICFNSNMAEYVNENISSLPNVYATTFHKLLSQYVPVNTREYSDIESLSIDFMESSNNSSHIYDCVVIDEGQDLLNIHVIDAIDAFLKQGMTSSRWVLFYDPNQNIFNHSSEFDETLEYVRELYNPVMHTLNTNCRNTEQIARMTAAISSVKPAKHLKIPGPKVERINYSSKKEFLTNLRTELTKLFQSGVSPIDIVLLSRYKLENSLLSDTSSVCNLPIRQNQSINEARERTLNYYTIQSFKGLESKIVFYIDMEGFFSDNDRMLNYVAMSRAQLKLYIFTPSEKDEEYVEALSQGLELFT